MGNILRAASPPRVQLPPIRVVTNGRGHEPLFTVNPNISAEDALVHVALYLRSAYETGYKALDYMREEGRGMFWSNLHAIEMAEGVVEAILDGIESALPPTSRPSQA